jgi:hypothetical protein
MEITAAKVKELYDKGVAATRIERQQAATNRAFASGRHWVSYNRQLDRLEEAPRDATRVRATVNRIGPDSRRNMAKLLRRPLVFEVLPTSADDAVVRASKIAEAALADLHARQGWESLRRLHAKLVWEQAIAGLCVEWDWTAGTLLEEGMGTGEPLISVVSLAEITTEPGTRDIEKARYWIRSRALPTKEVQDMFQMEKEPQADARPSDISYRVGASPETSGENIKLTLVHTYFGRPTPSKPEGCVCTVVGSQIVDGPHPWPFPFTDRLNIAVATPDPSATSWIGLTPVSDAIYIQALYNSSWSSIIEHMKLAGNARLFSPIGALEDPDALTDTPGEIVEFNPINGMGPKYETPPSMPDWWVRMPAMLQSEMNNVMSVFDVGRGNAPSGIESGVALSVLSENEDTPMGALAKELAECWGRVATMTLKLLQEYATEQRDATVYMSDVPEVIHWTGGDLLNQCLATVPLDAVMPRSRAAQAAFALQLHDRGLIKDPTQLAEVADLPNQNSLMEGLDPDAAKAMRENMHMAQGKPREVAIEDEHQRHIDRHNNFMKSERFEHLAPEVQELVRLHRQAHETYAAEQAARQLQQTMMNPVLAEAPQAASRPVDPGIVAAGAAMAQRPAEMDMAPPPEEQEMMQ